MSAESAGHAARADEGGVGDPARSVRPWSMAAAMEPVAPVAPPPARPGHGVALVAHERAEQVSTSPPRGGALTLLLLLAVTAICVLLFLLGR